jgi:hypothetical protein
VVEEGWEELQGIFIRLWHGRAGKTPGKVKGLRDRE